MAQSKLTGNRDRTLLAELFVTLGEILTALGEMKEAEKAYRDAESIFRRNDSMEGQSRALNLLAGLFYRQNDYKNALSSLMDAVRSVSYALPVTYGVEALREIMLGGRSPGAKTLLPLVGMSAGFYLASVLVYTWQNKRA